MLVTQGEVSLGNMKTPNLNGSSSKDIYLSYFMSSEVSCPADMVTVYVIFSPESRSTGQPPSDNHGSGKESSGGICSCG